MFSYQLIKSNEGALILSVFVLRDYDHSFFFYIVSIFVEFPLSHFNHIDITSYYEHYFVLLERYILFNFSMLHVMSSTLLYMHRPSEQITALV